jgi:hypothetical protein
MNNKNNKPKFDSNLTRTNPAFTKKNVTNPMMSRYCTIFAVDLSQTKGIKS